MSVKYKKCSYLISQPVFIAGFILSIMSASGCKSVPDLRKLPDGNYRQSLSHLSYAAATPVRDLNIATQAIPSQLQRLQNPYGTDTYKSCSNLKSEINAIQYALHENRGRNPGTLHTRRTRAGNLGNAVDASAKTLTTALIPFRGVVRFASGASYRDKQAQEADRLGRERLGFLIGVGSANNCPGFNPSSPRLR